MTSTSQHQSAEHHDHLDALIAFHSRGVALPSVPAQRPVEPRFEVESFDVADGNLGAAHDIVKAGGGRVVRSSITGTGYRVTAEYPA